MSNAVDENGKATMPAGEVDLDNESNSGSSLSDDSIDDIDEDELIIGVLEQCEEDDEEDDDGLEDEDDDDDNATYSTDASSTTSTSSTVNDSQDNTRVCDCCYCEVFGHGVTPVAPTSRNFQEMRERLRQRLSKRRQERCQNDLRLECPAAEPTKSDHPTDKGGGDDTGGLDEDLPSRVGPASKKINRRGKNNDKGLMGDSTIEEILNFINGTPKDKPLSKRKKDKSKSVNNEKSKSRSINATTSNAKENKYSDKCCQQQQHPNNPSGNNGNSHHNQSLSTRVSRVSPAPNKRQQQQHNSSTTEQSHLTSNNQNPRRKASSSKSSCEASTAQSTCSESQNDDGPVMLAKDEKVRQKKRDKVNIVNKLTSNNVKPHQHNNNNNIASANGGKSSNVSNASSRESSRANSSSLTAVTTRENKASNNRLQTAQTSKRVNQHSSPLHNPSSCDVPQQATNRAICQRREQDESLQTSILEEYLEDHVPLSATTPDDVFKPRDIDLDDDRLDEFERELEAFKRFCLDSIPLVKKERVRIQLKDSNCFKEFNDRPAIKPRLPSDRRTKRGPQAQGKRPNGQYLSRDTQNFGFVI